MLLREAKEVLKKNGFRLVEDTDDYDDADLGIGVERKRYRSNDDLNKFVRFGTYQKPTNKEHFAEPHAGIHDKLNNAKSYSLAQKIDWDGIKKAIKILNAKLPKSFEPANHPDGGKYDNTLSTIDDSIENSIQIIKDAKDGYPTILYYAIREEDDDYETEIIISNGSYNSNPTKFDITYNDWIYELDEVNKVISIINGDYDKE